MVPSASWLNGCAFRGRERRRLGEAHVHKDVIERIESTAQDHVGAAALELEGGEVDGAQRRGAGSVDHAVGAVQVESIGDAPRHDVGQQPREGALLPGHVALGDALDHVLAGLRIDSRLFQGLAPDRVAEARPQWNHQGQCPAHAQDDAGAVAVELALLRAVPGVPQGLPGHVQAQQLRGVRRFEITRGDAERHRFEVDGVEEPAPAAVRHIGCLGIGVEVV